MKTLVLPFLFFLCFASIEKLEAEHWNQFRGPNGSGVATKNFNPPIKINNEKVKNAIKSCDFKVMVKNEAKFPEAVLNKKGKKIKFFSLGPKHDWKKTLDPKIATQLKKVFKKEMKELGYI